MWYPVNFHLRKHHLQPSKYLRGWECIIRLSDYSFIQKIHRISDAPVDSYYTHEILKSCHLCGVVWRLKDLTKPLVLFPEKVNLLPCLLFLNLLNGTASVSVFVVISVLLGLHLTEEIAISMNSETEIFLWWYQPKQMKGL